MLKQTLKIGALIGLSLVLGLPAQAAPNKPTLVQYYIRTQSDTLMNNLRLDFIKKARSLHIKVHTYDALNDDQEQLKQFEHEFSNNIPVMLDVANPEHDKKFFEKTHKALTPMIFLDHEPHTLDLNKTKVTWYIGAHKDEAGKLQGEMIKNYLKRHAQDFDHNNNGTLDVVFITGPKKLPECQSRQELVEKALNESGVKYNIAETLECDWSFEQAYMKLEQVLQKQKIDNFEMVVCQNDDMALGAINALQEHAGDEETEHFFPAVYGIDGTPDAMDAMAEGTLNGTVKLDTRLICDLALSIIRGNDSYEHLSKIAGFKVDNHYIYLPYHPLEFER
ncbi:MAG: substrate-binding domain-containing protein [Succinivibrio sp.]|nr:substrate-binding domain-containing protein [Succinivibrio sp.]